MTKTSRGLTLLALACTAVLPACSDSTGSKPGPAAHLDIVGGNTQTGVVGTQLAQPLVVKATDANGHVLKGQVVNFVVTAGGGHVFAGTAITDQSGIAQELWTLGTVAGAAQTVEARAVDTSTGQALVFATFTATATAGAPTQAVAVKGDTAVTGVPGSAVEDSFAVLVRDQYGNPTPGVQVAWAVTSGGGSITTPSTTDAAGIARTQWVLGAAGSATQTAQATAGGATVRFAAFPVTALTRLAGDGAVQGAGSVVTVTVGTNGPAGLPIHWTVTSGGGSVAPAVGPTGGGASSTASASWTLGPAGPQTLTASAGSLSVTFTATSVVAGHRTQLANVNGRILDLDATRVLYVDSTSGPSRQVRLRTLAGGAEVVVDSGFAGRLTPGGALVVRGSPQTLVEVSAAGGTTSLGPIGSLFAFSTPLLAVSGNWAAWETATVGTVIRRDLLAGTNVTVATPPAGTPTRASLDVGSNGDVVYEYYYGGGAGGTSHVKLYHDGTVTDVYSSSSVGMTFPQTDGGNVVYVPFSLSTGLDQWLWHAGTTELLTHAPAPGTSSSGQPEVRVAGGWVAYLRINNPFTPDRSTQVRLRTPANADEGVSQSGVGRAAHLEALCPDGSVVYLEGTFPPTGGPDFTRRYIAYRGGPLVDAGAPTSDAVVCRGGRFFMFSGGTGYELSQ
jgi:Bacterial Ig-like domain (group 1)